MSSVDYNLDDAAKLRRPRRGIRFAGRRSGGGGRFFNGRRNIQGGMDGIINTGLGTQTGGVIYKLVPMQNAVGAGTRRQRNDQFFYTPQVPRFDPMGSEAAQTWKRGAQRKTSARASQQFSRTPVTRINGTKVNVRNLHYDVDENTLRDTFARCGTINSVRIHFDNTDRSTGEAEVIFSRMSDAETCVNQFNGYKFEEQPIQVELAIQTKVRGGIERGTQSVGEWSDRGTGIDWSNERHYWAERRSRTPRNDIDGFVSGRRLGSNQNRRSGGQRRRDDWNARSQDDYDRELTNYFQNE